MSDNPKKGSLQSLVSQALGQNQQPAEEPAQEAPEPTQEPLGDAEALIAIYFELEAPEERDEVFDQLATHQGEMVNNFFAEMASHDDDPYVRAAACAELFRRGHQEYLATLESDIMDPQELFFFANALHTLADVRGQEFYPDLVQMLADPNRDPDHQQDIMLAMEAVAPEQSVKHFTALLSGWSQVGEIDEMFMEYASLAIARQSYGPGHEILKKISNLVEESSIDAAEKEELLELLTEALSITTIEPTA
jgi:hypothetical protein